MWMLTELDGILEDYDELDDALSMKCGSGLDFYLGDTTQEHVNEDIGTWIRYTENATQIWQTYEGEALPDFKK